MWNKESFVLYRDVIDYVASWLDKIIFHNFEEMLLSDQDYY